MNKLISKTPVLRFKLGRKIVKASGGKKVLDPNRFVSIYDKNGIWAANANQEGLTNRNQVRDFLRDVLKMGDASDGIWGKNTEAAYLKYLASKQSSSPTYNMGTFDSNWKFTPGETTSDINVVKQYLTPKLEIFEPGTYTGDPTRTYNAGNIRANRGLNYSNVDEYWNYLNNNKNSDDYQLFQNIMRTTDGNLNRDAFNLIMSLYGISGNLGRRDSGRLANLLNTLRLIGTRGSDARNSFIDNYNKNFLNLKSLNEGQKAINNSVPKPDVPTTIFPTYYNTNNNYDSSTLYVKQGGQLISNNPVKRFKEGNKIIFARGGTKTRTTPIKRFVLAASDNSFRREFDSQQEAEAYRKAHKIVGVIRDQKNASNGSVVKSSRVTGKDAKTTAYDRQEAEKPYNNLSLKEAYKKAQSSGNLFFAYKGKVYKTDLKNGKDNITDMIKMYGNNLGWDKDPKLQNKPSRAARELYRKNTKAVDNSRPVKPLETNSSANEKADKYAKDTWNGGKGFTDLMMPNNVVMKLGEKAVDKLFGTNYSNNNIYKFGLNPFGIAEDAAEGNLGGLALRGLDAYAWLGMPGASQFVDRLLTAHAPKLLEVASTSKYVPKGGLENGTLNKWNWNSLAKWGSPATRDSYRRGIRATVTEGGRRSMQRAANEGVEIGGFKGFDKARQWATNFGLNTNTGTTFFFRGNPTGYDIAADRAVLLTPYIAAPVDATAQILDTHPIE